MTEKLFTGMLNNNQNKKQNKKYSMCKTFMIGAMKAVSLLFDQPTYVAKTKALIS